MSKHTPGPWVAEQRDGEQIIRRENSLGLTGYVGTLMTGNDECHANGSLIVAAPDMLQALSNAQNALVATRHLLMKYAETKDHSWLWSIDQDIAKIKAARSKATSHSPSDR